MKRLLSIILALGLLPVAADAQNKSSLRKLDTEYSAKIWRAVGRVDLGGGRAYCSGTLIAPDLVLTAAHCLYKGNTSQQFAPSEIIFRAGVRNGQAAATRRVKVAAAHDGFRPEDYMTMNNVRHDVALLRLAEPISSYEIPSFKLYQGNVKPGPVSVVSYGRGRSDTQSRQKECNMTDRASDVFFFDCESVPGTSGAPVFSHINGRGQIMSVISGSASNGTNRRSVGMNLPERVLEVRRQLRMQTPTPKAQVRRLGVGSRSGGAKFVRTPGS